jgi:hypothetical protein
MAIPYNIPDNDPSDVEAAALEVIVELPAAALHSDAFALVLRAYAALLREDGAFVGLAWSDARQIAVSIARVLVDSEDAAAALLNHARDVNAAASTPQWRDRHVAARAFAVAAAAHVP